MSRLHCVRVWGFLGLAVIGLIALRFGSIQDSLLVNRASLEPSQALMTSFTALPTRPELLQCDDEQLLRLSVIRQCVQGNLTVADELLRRYVIVASPDQIEQMEHWIARWSVQLADRGEHVRAEQTMRLQFVLSDDAMAYARIAQLYQSLGRMDWAEQLLAQSLALRPDAGVFMQLGALYAEQGMPLMETDYYEATRLLTLAGQAFESAARLDPTVSVYANYRLGDIYWKLNRRQDAVHAYRQAAEGGGTGHYAFLSWYYLGQIYSAWWNGGLDYESARGYFERALAIAATKREDAMSLSGIAATYAAQGRKAEALAAYQRALKNDPAYEPAQRALNELENGQ
jgi:tetratricopeptide (TPR) repeat protein